jgi:selenocysteine lyase/cysteine desulfurase
VGARLFVDLTQLLGVLRHDANTVRADYVATHGYKWLLCPRGTAWLVTRADRLAELRPLAPHWHSTSLPRGYFGGPAKLANDASRCDASPAWFSWSGACAALEVHGGLDPAAVEAYSVGLAERLADDATEAGLRRMSSAESPILVFGIEEPERVGRELATLRTSRPRARHCARRSVDQRREKRR